MNRLLKTPLLFIFFCLISCDAIGPYRDIEIVILGTDYATINFYNQDSTLIATEPFDREYGESVHVGYIEDGYLLIEIVIYKTQKLTIDSSFNYKDTLRWAIYT